MTDLKSEPGFAVALAWPQTYCKQPGSWYDAPMRWLGISNNHFYKVGHAALLLISQHQDKCYYFDFGRYHAPFQHGRVRGAETDHELCIKTLPQISYDEREILNIREILDELQQNKACHGDGPLRAAYCKIDFAAAFQKAVEMQEAGPIAYGPFVKNGTNCSRFVNTVILAGRPQSKIKKKLSKTFLNSPTPLDNVNALTNSMIIPAFLNAGLKIQPPVISREKLASTLEAPLRHKKIPKTAQWLSGEGAGSWFHLESDFPFFNITRFNSQGEIECKGFFILPGKSSFEPGLPYRFVHLSHCRQVSVEQNGKVLMFRRLDLKEAKEAGIESMTGAADHTGPCD
jgi:hypothetical protein